MKSKITRNKKLIATFVSSNNKFTVIQKNSIKEMFDYWKIELQTNNLKKIKKTINSKIIKKIHIDDEVSKNSNEDNSEKQLLKIEENKEFSSNNENYTNQNLLNKSVEFFDEGYIVNLKNDDDFLENSNIKKKYNLIKAKIRYFF